MSKGKKQSFWNKDSTKDFLRGAREVVTMAAAWGASFGVIAGVDTAFAPIASIASVAAIGTFFGTVVAAVYAGVGAIISPGDDTKAKKRGVALATLVIGSASIYSALKCSEPFKSQEPKTSIRDEYNIKCNRNAPTSETHKIDMGNGHTITLPKNCGF